MSDQKYREAALARRYGMSAEAKERLDEANAIAQWYGKCRVCGAELKGTPAEIAKHKHG